MHVSTQYIVGIQEMMAESQFVGKASFIGVKSIVGFLEQNPECGKKRTKSCRKFRQPPFSPPCSLCVCLGELHLDGAARMMESTRNLERGPG